MPIPLRALIVEDRPDDAELILHELRRSGYEVEPWTVDNESAFVAALEAVPDIILSDYSMAQFGSRRALTLLQASGRDIPLIVVTGSISEEVAVECMKNGAADYILKDRMTRLGAAVGQALKARAARDAARLAQAALRISEERFERAVNAAHIGTWDWDLETGKIIWSAGHAEIFGVRPENFDGRYETFAERVHPDDRQRVNDAAARARDEKSLYDEEYRVVWPDGTERWIHGTGRFTYDEAGRAVRMAGVVQDVTERRHAEEEVSAKEEQLRQAQKMEAVGALASGIAHDINNLLTVIFGSVETARLTTVTDENLNTALDRVEEAAQQAAGVTRGLLAFARRTPLERRPMNLCAAIARTTRLLGRMLPATIELRVEKPPEAELWVCADETHLQQLVLNLAINARDAMPDGGKLCIRLSPVSAAEAAPLGLHAGDLGTFAGLQVIDTGAGIAPEIIDRIFDPFFTTKPRGQGTGLGLAIAHSIAEEHGAHLAVASTLGQGTTFTLTLPSVAPAASGETAPGIDVRGHGELILVVEDHQPVREIVVGTLRARGYEVATASDGDAAWRAFAQHQKHIQAVVLDVDLPKRSGLDVLREIRAGGSQIPVVVVTGKAEAGLEESLDPHSTLLSKPFRVAELANLLGRRLRARRMSETQP